MRKTRRTYWITEVVSPLCRERALLLAAKGYDVQFFTSLDTMLGELATKRAHIVIVSDEGKDEGTQRILQALMSTPEIQGARLVLIRSRPSEALSRLAACAQFRDIIPMQLDDKQWLSRFVFATAGKSLKYVQPAGQIALKNISAAVLPARVTWMSSRRMRLECRLRPPAGSTLTLRGPLAAAVGAETLSLKVVEMQRSHLLYRFSDAVVAEWTAPDEARVMRVLAELRQVSTGPRCRIFVAVQNNALRNQILSRFEDPRFDVSTALQKLSIVEEPRYFSPDVVIIEDALCKGDEATRFQQMLGNLPSEATVVVLGQLDGFEELKQRNAQRKLLLLPKLPKTLSQSILARYLPLHETRMSAADKDACHIPSEHMLSQAEVSVPARLSRVHPSAAQIALPIPLSNFALARIESPLLHRILGRDPYVKITETCQDAHPDAGQFVYLAEGYLADIDQQERATLASSLAKLIAETFAKGDDGESLAGGKLDGTQRRMPELGSLRDARVVPFPAAAPATGLAAGSVRSSSASALLDSIAPAANAGAARVLTDPQLGELIFEDAPIIIPAHDEEQTKQVAPAPAVEVKPNATEKQRHGQRSDTIYSIPRAATPAPVRKPQPQTSVIKDLLVFARYASIIAVMLLIFWACVKYVVPSWEHSGSVYSDQLKQFAPQTNSQQQQP